MDGYIFVTWARDGGHGARLYACVECWALVAQEFAAAHTVWHENAATPGPIPRGDQAGRASAPGEGARS